MSTIHETAIIHESAKVDPTVEIGPYCVIGPETTIDARTRLMDHVTIESHTTMGTDNLVFPYSVIGSSPQDKKFSGEQSWCHIGNSNQIREHVTIHRGTGNGGGVTSIGDDNLIMVAAHIAHDCRVGNRSVIANQVMLAGHVHVGDAANIGGGAGIHHFATIGTCSFVGGLARITRDVPPFMIVEGNPAEVRGHNHIAMKRLGYQDNHIEAIKDAYKRLYRENGARMLEKMEQLRTDYPDHDAISMLCMALEAAAQGVHGRALEVLRTDDKRAVSTS